MEERYAKNIPNPRQLLLPFVENISDLTRNTDFTPDLVLEEEEILSILSRPQRFRALANGLKRALYKFVPPKGIICELGSGIGLWYKALPEEYKPHWMQLEWNQNFIEETRKRFPEVEVQKGSIYNLPFLPETIDAVVDLCALDTLGDLSKGIREIHRVLKKGGILLHLQDLDAHYTPIASELREKGYFPVFWGEKPRISLIGYFKDPKDEEEYSKILNIAKEEGYAHPEYHPQILRLLKNRMIPLNTTEYFKDKLINLLKNLGFKRIKTGEIVGEIERASYGEEERVIIPYVFARKG